MVSLFTLGYIRAVATPILCGIFSESLTIRPLNRRYIHGLSVILCLAGLAAEEDLSPVYAPYDNCRCDYVRRIDFFSVTFISSKP